MVPLLVVVAGSAIHTGAADARSRACADAVIRNPDGNVYTQTHDLRVTRVSCSIARRVALDILHGTEGTENPRTQSRGFRCVGERSGNRVVCRRGSRRITWDYAR